MKKALFLLLSILVLGTHQAKSTIVFTMINPDNSLPSATVLAGETFDLSVAFTSTSENLLGITFFLNSDIEGSGFFEITSVVDRSFSPFLEFQSTNAQIIQSPGSILSPRNARDLGGTEADFAPVPPGTYVLGVFRITTLPALSNGAYTLSLSDVAVFDENISQVPADSTTTFSVTVIPEPTALLLASLGLSALLIRHRRR